MLKWAAGDYLSINANFFVFVLNILKWMSSNIQYNDNKKIALESPDFCFLYQSLQNTLYEITVSELAFECFSKQVALL